VENNDGAFIERRRVEEEKEMKRFWVKGTRKNP